MAKAEIGIQSEKFQKFIDKNKLTKDMRSFVERSQSPAESHMGIVV